MLINFCNNIFFNSVKSKIIIVNLLVLTLAGCRQTIYEPRHKTIDLTIEKEQVSNVDKVFDLAKDFASGLKSAQEVRKEFEALTAKEQEELYEKQEGSSSFVVLMTIGPQDQDSAFVIEKSINAGSKKAKDQMFGKALLKELISTKRPKDDDATSRKVALQKVLVRYPEQINELKTAKGIFDENQFNQLVASLDGAQLTPLIEKLTQENLKAFVNWAMDQGPDGKTRFKALYDKVPTVQQKLRTSLLEKCVSIAATRIACIEGLIDQGTDWDINIGTDTFELSSSIPGTLFSGPLIKILSRFLIEEFSKSKDISLFSELLQYAKKIKVIMGEIPYRDAVTTRPTTGGGIISDLLAHILKPSHRHYWAGYFLDIPQAKDVFGAVKDNFVSNDSLKELYDLIIDNEKAKELSLEPDPAGPHFIHYLLERPSDENIYWILDDFLNKASEGNIDAEMRLLTDNANADKKNAIQILRKAGRSSADQAIFHRKIYERLVKNDTGEAVSLLSDAELADLAKGAYESSGIGGSAQANFKDLLNKIESVFFKAKAFVVTKLAEKNAATASGDAALEAQTIIKLDEANEKLKTTENQLILLRSELLKNAYDEGPRALEDFIKEIVGNTDPWGLRDTVDTDVYDLNGVKGTLLGVLTQDAAKKFAINTNLLKELRNYAGHFKTSMGEAAFKNYIESPMAENNNEPIRKFVDDVLTPLNRQDFTDYYFASETAKNVYDAARRDEAMVHNGMLKEIYDLIIGNVPAAAFALKNEPMGLGPKDFIHQLLKRSADADTLYILNKYLSGLFAKAPDALQGGQEERDELAKTNSSGERPLKIFIERPVGFVEDRGKKMQMIARLLSHANADAFIGMSSSELAKMMSIIMSNPALSKKVYGLFDPLSVNAKILRSTLLFEFYKNGSSQTKKILTDFTNNADIWGVKASVTDEAQEYELRMDPAGPLHTGPLLYVLVMAALDKGGKAYLELTDYATIIKNAFIAAGKNYDNFVAVSLFGPPPQKSIKAALENALVSGEKFFANRYLAREGFVDVYEAAFEPEANVSNAMLKTLYLSVIGHDAAKVTNLAQHGGGHVDKFIHKLVGRTADENTLQILQFFLDDLGPANEPNQLKTPNTSGKYPLQILVNETRLNFGPENDLPLSKTKMIARLLEQEDGTVLRLVTFDEFYALRIFFRSQDVGKTVFKKLYTDPVMTKVGGGAKRRALASSLINESKDRKVVEEITSVSDPWGLRPLLKNAKYQLDAYSGGGAPPYEGSLLYVLTRRAVDEFLAIRDGFVVLKDLRSSAERIRTVVEQNPGDYVDYAQKPDTNAVVVLRNFLKNKFPNKIGLTEYYLDLDATAPGFDENLVFAAAANDFQPGVFDGAQLRWLYEKAITSGEKAANLVFHSSKEGNFITLLTEKTMSSATAFIFEDFLDKVTKEAGADITASAIETQNSKGENALQIITKKDRTDTGVERNKAVLLLANAANKETIGVLNSYQVQFMLSGIRDAGVAADLTRAFFLFEDAQMYAVAEWCAERKKVIIKGTGRTELKDNLENPDIRNAFSDEYNRRPSAREDMQNNLIKKAFEVGAQDSKRGAFERVADVIEKDLLPSATLREYSWNPFSNDPAKKHGLLFVLFNQTEPSREEDVSELVTKMKNKFPSTAEWQNYLNTSLQGSSTFDLVKRNIARLMPRGTTPAQHEAAAKTWLQYE